MPLPTYIKRLLIGLVVLLGLLLVWGTAIEPRLVDTEEYAVSIANLPAAWDGQRIAVVADFQVGMWLANTDTIRRLVADLIAERPALVIIAGDFVYGPDEDISAAIQTVTDLLQPLTQATIPTYAVLGNHDYKVSSQEEPVDIQQAEQVRAALETINIEVLHNTAVPLELHRSPAEPTGAGNTASLYLVGIGPHIPDEDRPTHALSQVPPAAPRIVVMHNPATFAALPANTAPLAVAGHTHGGQMRIPFTPEWSWLTFVEGEPVHADGWIRDYGQPGNRLYVNRGIGFSIVPIRINCPPELTLFTLQRPAG